MNNVTPVAKLIEQTGLNDYQLARRVGASRSAIRALRVGQNAEPGLTLGLRLIDLAGIRTIPSALRAIDNEAAECG